MITTLLNLTLALTVSANAEDTTPTERRIEQFTLGDIQLMVGPDFGRIKLTAFSNIGPRTQNTGMHRFSATLFAQLGGDFAWQPNSAATDPATTDTSAAAFQSGGWVIGQAGLNWAIDAGPVSIHQKLRGGGLWLLPSSTFLPQLGHSLWLTGFDQRLNVLWINSWSFDRAAQGSATVGYYYEGYVDGGPWRHGPRLGLFWEQIYGPAAGPRFAIGGFYVHVNVVDAPVVYAGYQFAL